MNAASATKLQRFAPRILFSPKTSSTILDASVDCKNKDHGSGFSFSGNANKINANKALVTLNDSACLRCMFHHGSLTFAQLLTCVMT